MAVSLSTAAGSTVCLTFMAFLMTLAGHEPSM